jgi:hypothetical protein
MARAPLEVWVGDAVFVVFARTSNNGKRCVRPDLALSFSTERGDAICV